MFTGIIEGMGRLAEAPRPLRDGARLTVHPATPFTDLKIGESIATNGVCLTAEPGSEPGALIFFASGETLRLTTLGGLAKGAGLNLERSLRGDSRLGGHLVMGHVDGVGEICRWENLGESWWLEVAFPPELARFIALKGSISVDGISLTVAALTPASFSVAVIPHTAAATNLSRAAVGSKVNLEADMLARYVVRALEAHTAAPQGTTLELLHRAGFTG